MSSSEDDDVGEGVTSSFLQPKDLEDFVPGGGDASDGPSGELDSFLDSDSESDDDEGGNEGKAASTAPAGPQPPGRFDAVLRIGGRFGAAFFGLVRDGVEFSCVWARQSFEAKRVVNMGDARSECQRLRRARGEDVL